MYFILEVVKPRPHDLQKSFEKERRSCIFRKGMHCALQ